MGSQVLQIVLGLGMTLVLTLLVLEVRGWITGSRLVNRKQKVLRALSGIFILVILAMILIGDSAVRAYHPLAAVGYWFVCFSLAVSVLLMALSDVKQVALRFGEERKHNFDDLAGRE